MWWYEWPLPAVKMCCFGHSSGGSKGEGGALPSPPFRTKISLISCFFQKIHKYVWSAPPSKELAPSPTTSAGSAPARKQNSDPTPTPPQNFRIPPTPRWFLCFCGRANFRKAPQPPLSVADPEFPRRGGGGAPTPKVLAKTYFLSNFFPKTVWKWKKLDMGGASLAPP